MSDDTKHFLRAQAWARAKGELEAVLVTYSGEQVYYDGMTKAMDEFIKLVEDEGWAE